MTQVDDLDSRFPSDPTEYDFSRHFKEDIIGGQRHLDWQKTLDTIRYGERQEADGSADIEFVRDYHGVKCFILVGWNSKKEKPVVVTGWPGIHDPRQAIESGRWNEKQLREINEFNNGNSLEEDFCFP